jgi:predicted membrane protein
MNVEEIKAFVIFLAIILVGGLFLFGFLLFAVIFIAIAMLLFLGFYAYIRLKLWWRKKHPPKVLEGPEDYF